MKIVKRNGQIVNYDASKISTAISKANAEVQINERIEDEKIQIPEFINVIEEVTNKEEYKNASLAKMLVKQ